MRNYDLPAPRGATAKAVLVLIAGRYRFFARWTKAGRISTAWSLAGATLFLGDLTIPELQNTLDRLTAEKRDYFVATVSYSLDGFTELKSPIIKGGEV